jgi:hypothetical protein
MTVAQSLFEQRVSSPRLGGRLVACVGLSILLHAALVAWTRLHPVEFDVADPPRLFTFDARFKREPPRIETPVAPQRRADPGIAKAPPLRPSGSVKPDAPAANTAPLQDAVRTAPDASEPAHIDLEKAKRLAVEYDRQQYKTADPRFDANARTPVPLEAETAASRAIAKAAKPDCREAYTGWGLLAIPLFIRDAATNSGCTW